MDIETSISLSASCENGEQRSLSAIKRNSELEGQNTLSNSMTIFTTLPKPAVDIAVCFLGESAGMNIVSWLALSTPSGRQTTTASASISIRSACILDSSSDGEDEDEDDDENDDEDDEDDEEDEDDDDEEEDEDCSIFTCKVIPL